MQAYSNSMATNSIGMATEIFLALGITLLLQRSSSVLQEPCSNFEPIRRQPSPTFT